MAWGRVGVGLRLEVAMISSLLSTSPCGQSRLLVDSDMSATSMGISILYQSYLRYV